MVNIPHVFFGFDRQSSHPAIAISFTRIQSAEFR